MIKRLTIFLVLFLVLGGAAAYFLLPWNKIIENRVMVFLQNNGVSNVSFQIDRIGLHTARLNNIAIGAENSLRLQSMTVAYQPREILDGRIETIELSGLAFQLTQTPDGWRVEGVDVPKSVTDEAGGRPAARILAILDSLPVQSVSITDSTLRIDGKVFDTSLPFRLTLTKGEKSVFDMTVLATSLELEKSGFSIGEWHVMAEQQEDKSWQGNWTLNSIDAYNLMPVPVLDANGTIKLDANAFTLDGTTSGTDKNYTAAFSALVDFMAPDKNKVTLQSGSFPFLNGRISTRNIDIPMNRAKNLTVTVSVQKISIDVMLQKMTGERVSATGTVSGTLPIIIRPDNSFVLGKGTLKADTEGVIKMAADAIPGDNQQIELVRQVLENLHYQLFSASVEPSADGKMAVHLALEGSNPAVYDGRLVKLNVNLTGDVLDFITQNAILFGNPEKLLEQ